MPAASLKASGSAPEVEIVVGHLHRADFEFWLYDQNGENPVKKFSGKTGDPEPDIKQLPESAAQLNRRTIWWQAGLVSFIGSGASEPFSVVVRLLQDGKIVGLDGSAGAAMTRPLFEGRFDITVVP